MKLRVAVFLMFAGLVGVLAWAWSGDEVGGEPRPAAVAGALQGLEARGGAVESDPVLAHEGEDPDADEERTVVTDSEAGASVALRHILVIAFSADGRSRVPGFEISLHRGEDEVVHAVTDAEGAAALPIEDDLVGTVRLQPRGWVGPLDSFPVLDAARLPEQPVHLLVPAHGFVRFELLREGMPATDPLPGWSRVERWKFVDTRGRTPPTEFKMKLARFYDVGDPHVIGPVALGLSIRCMLALSPLRGTQFHDLVQGPAAPGEDVRIPIELGPDEGEASLQILRHDGAPLGHQEVSCRIYTTTGERLPWKPSAVRELRTDEEGRVVVSMRGLAGEGIYVPYLVAVAGPLSGTLEIGHFPEPGEDLGTLSLEAPEPYVRGTVVSADGRPMPRASVSLVFAGAHGQREALGGPVVTDRRGRFELFLQRETNSALRIHVVTATGRFHDHGKVKRGDDVTVRVGGQGAIEVSFLDDVGPESDHPFPVVELRLGRYPWFHDGRIVRERGLWRREGLEAATIDVALRNGAYGEDLLIIEDVAIPAEGVCRDPRLQGLRISELIRTVDLLIVDEHDRPFEGAKLTRRIPGERSSFRSREDSEVSDDQGRVRFQLPGVQEQLRVDVEADGYRDRSFSVRTDAAEVSRVVELDPEGFMKVHVAGLPPDVDPTEVRVGLKEAQETEDLILPRDNLRPSARLGPDGSCVFEIPPRGQYRWTMSIWRDSPSPANRRAMMLDGPFVEIGRGMGPFFFQVTEEMRAEIRERLE